MVGWAVGRRVGGLEISAVILIIAMLQIGRQRVLRQAAMA